MNKPGTKVKVLVGGVLGGCVIQGLFGLGDEIEIRPGYEVEEKNQKRYIPLKTKIVGFMTGSESVKNIHPGGSVAILTQLDPSIVKSDKLTGSVVGKVGTLPPVWIELCLETKLLQRVVGSKEDMDVKPIKIAEPLMLNVNSAATVGIVYDLGKNMFKCKLKIPVCAAIGARVTISRKIGTRFRLIGFGIIKKIK